MTTPYLLVIGSAKSGTSSLFRYLADHPDVCGANLKETYFFAPEFDANDRHGSDEGRDEFDQYFTHASRPDQLRVEATPFTMYAEGSAERIAATLPGAKVLCLVREPVSRFVSDYRFLKQRGSLGDPEPSAEAFVETQLAQPEARQTTLGIGRYADFLPAFTAALGPENVDVVFFEELKADPAGQMERLAARHGLAAGFYDDYSFLVINKTIVVGNRFVNDMRMRLESPVRAVRNLVLGHDRMHRLFERIVDVGRSGLEELSGSGGDDEAPIPASALDALAAHYREPNERLAHQIDRDLPSAWNQRERLVTP